MNECLRRLPEIGLAFSEAEAPAARAAIELAAWAIEHPWECRGSPATALGLTRDQRDAAGILRLPTDLGLAILAIVERMETEETAP
jgi:hypothetical protein